MKVNQLKAGVVLSYTGMVVSNIISLVYTPVMLRLSTRIAHSRSIVDTTDREDVPLKPYEKNQAKNIMLPAFARPKHEAVEKRTAAAKGARNLSACLSGVTDQEVQREREEILNVSQADIQALAGILEEILKTDALCAIGNGGQIRESSGMFCTTESLYH